MPTLGGISAAGCQRQHPTDHAAQALLKDFAQSFAFQHIVKPRVERVNVDRQFAFTPQVVKGVLKARLDRPFADPQIPAQGAHKPLGIGVGCSAWEAFVGKKIRVAPTGSAVGSPE